MIGGQDQRLGFFIVGIAARVLAPVLFAGAALEALLALFGVTVADKVGTAAVQTSQWLSKRESILPDQTHLGHYRNPGLLQSDCLPSQTSDHSRRASSSVCEGRQSHLKSPALPVQDTYARGLFLSCSPIIGGWGDGELGGW